MAEDKQAAKAPKAPKVVRLNVGVNAFCRPGDLVGMAGIVRVSELDEEHCVNAGKVVVEAAKKGGLFRDGDRRASNWLRELNIRGAAAMKMSDDKLLADFNAECTKVANKQSHVHESEAKEKAADEAAEKAMKDHAARKAAHRGLAPPTTDE